MNYQSKNIKDFNGRWTALQKKFDEFFPSKCTVAIHAPGRINLIGEHIDYSGYPVMPIATDLTISIAASVRDDQVLHMCNMDAKYSDYRININNIRIDISQPKWYNYILCGIKGLMDERADFKPTGISLAVNGDIPPGCGLSSSSALVCGASLAAVKLYGLNIEKFELAKMCARFERLVGTEGGGMDQAASLLSNEGYANLIEFSPLRTTAVELPKGCVFVLANSLVEKQKALDSDFNQRVMECRLASFILAKNEGLEWEQFTKLGDLQKRMEKSHSEMTELVEKHIQKVAYTQADLCSTLGISDEKLHQIISVNTKHISAFHLYSRATHVFLEAIRVYEFSDICDKLVRDQQYQAKAQEQIQRLGKLMYDSHDSLRDLYECSHEKLDRIVELSKGVAYGARLTGAGWGGCVVALVAENMVEAYRQRLREKFYPEGMELDPLVCFVVKPGNGAETFNV